MSLKLLYYPNPSLSKVCQKVTEFDQNLVDLVSNMTKIMQKYKGVGLAANQVGIHKQVIVLITNQNEIQALINPEIHDQDPEQVILQEGCLSAPSIIVPIKRSVGVHIKYQDLEGKPKQVLAYGQDARIFLHEYDHLQGKFYFDRLSDLVKQNAINELRKQK